MSYLIETIYVSPFFIFIIGLWLGLMIAYLVAIVRHNILSGNLSNIEIIWFVVSILLLATGVLIIAVQYSDIRFSYSLIFLTGFVFSIIPIILFIKKFNHLVLGDKNV